jgi:hypothetical protein
MIPSNKRLIDFSDRDAYKVKGDAVTGLHPLAGCSSRSACYVVQRTAKSK